MTLRLANENDFPEILRMAKRFHEISPYRGLPFSEDSCKNVFDFYLRGDKTDIVIILAGDNPYGMLIACANQLPFSEDKVAMELAWWVDEDKRGSKDSLLMKKAYEAWARKIGASITQMAMLDEVTNLDKFYRKQGYVPAERSYIKET